MSSLLKEIKITDLLTRHSAGFLTSKLFHIHSNWIVDTKEYLFRIQIPLLVFIFSTHRGDEIWTKVASFHSAPS
jgi:hypothetical protein